MAALLGRGEAEGQREIGELEPDAKPRGAQERAGVIVRVRLREDVVEQVFELGGGGAVTCESGSPSPSRWRLSLQGTDERRSPLDQVLVELALDRLPHLLGDLEQQAAVLGGVRAVLREVDRLAELDPPLRRERAPAQAARATGRSGSPGRRERPSPARAAGRRRASGRSPRTRRRRPARSARRSAAPPRRSRRARSAAGGSARRTACPVPLAPSGNDHHQLVLLEEPGGVVGARRHPADPAHERRDEREHERPVEHQEAGPPRQRVLLHDRQQDHRRVEGEQRAGVVGDEERPPVGGDVRTPSASTRHQTS